PSVGLLSAICAFAIAVGLSTATRRRRNRCCISGPTKRCLPGRYRLPVARLVDRCRVVLRLSVEAGRGAEDRSRLDCCGGSKSSTTWFSPTSTDYAAHEQGGVCLLNRTVTR